MLLSCGYYRIYEPRICQQQREEDKEPKRCVRPVKQTGLRYIPYCEPDKARIDGV